MFDFSAPASRGALVRIRSFRARDRTWCAVSRLDWNYAAAMFLVESWRLVDLEIRNGLKWELRVLSLFSDFPGGFVFRFCCNNGECRYCSV